MKVTSKFQNFNVLTFGIIHAKTLTNISRPNAIFYISIFLYHAIKFVHHVSCSARTFHIRFQFLISATSTIISDHYIKLFYNFSSLVAILTITCGNLADFLILIEYIKFCSFDRITSRERSKLKPPVWHEILVGKEPVLF